VNWFYYIAKTVVKVLLKLLTRWQVNDIGNVPSQGPVLVVANHINLADPPLLGVSLGRRVRFMAKKELFHFRVIGFFMSSLGAFPVYRGQLDRRALRQANQILADGQVLVIFPEGRRSHIGQLRSAFSGSALVALRSGAPILPVGITGTEKLRGIAWLLRRPRITVNIGRTFCLPTVGSRLTKPELVKLTSYMMGQIAGLLPQEYRGDYVVEGK